MTHHETTEAAKGGGIALGTTLGTLASLAAGFTLGLLFAPQSGQETRRQISSKASYMASQINQCMARVKHMCRRGARVEIEPGR